MLSYAEMHALCAELQTLLKNAALQSFREISSLKWILRLKTASGSKALLISLKYPFSRFHLTEKNDKGVVTPFTQVIEEALGGALLKEIQLLDRDRILELWFERNTGDFSLIFEFFSKSWNGYLLDASNKILFSLKKTAESIYHPPISSLLGNSKSVTCTSREIEELYERLEQEHAFQKEKNALSRALQEELSKKQKLSQAFLLEMEKGKKWKEVAHEAHLLQTHFYQLRRGLFEIELEDWENDGKHCKILLDPKLEPSIQLQKRFHVSKKLKNKFEHARKFYEALQPQIASLRDDLNALQNIESKEELEHFKKEKVFSDKQKKSALKKKPSGEKKPFKEFTTQSGLRIYVGKSDKDNEKLTFSYAQGHDLWLHSGSFPGSHVILKIPKGKTADQESLLDALQLAFFYSKAKKQGWDQIIVTECKYVSRGKHRKAGSVDISKHKKIEVREDASRLKKLFSRQEELPLL